MSLAQLVYVSRSNASASARARLDDLRSILSSSRRNNSRDGLTGFLICDGDLFVQILEGAPETVSATYDRITRDERHRQPTLLSRRDVGRRTFPEWSMGGVSRSLEHTEIFLRNGFSGPLDPQRITAPAIIALAMDLQDFEIAQRRTLSAAC